MAAATAGPDSRTAGTVRRPAPDEPVLLRSDHRPVRTPTILQIEAVECGAAALGMILAHYGRWVPLDELRRQCGVTRDGSRASRMVAAARNYGLEARGRRWSLEELSQAREPVVLWWRFNHFVVFEGIRGGRAQLNDPASGRRMVERRELDESFTGIVLTFAPTDEFEPSGEPPSSIRSLSRRTSGVRDGMTLAVIVGLLTVVPGLVIPAISAAFIDDVLTQDDRAFAPVLVVGMAASGMVAAGLAWMQATTLLRVQNALASRGATVFLWRVVRLPVEFFSQRSFTDITMRMTSSTTIAGVIGSQLTGLAVSMLTAVVYGAAMMAYSLRLALIVFFLLALNLLAVRVVIRRRETATRAVLQQRAALETTTYVGVRTIETLKATSSEGAFFSRWAGQQARIIDTKNRLAGPTVALSAVPVFLSSLSLVAIIVVGGLEVIRGALTIGGLVAFQSLVVSFSAPVHQMVGFGGQMQALGAEMRRLDDVLEHPVDQAFQQPGAPRDSMPPAGLRGRVEVADVTFGYSIADPPLVSDLSFELQPGTRTALVGRSGAGKTTALRLVSGILHPWSGQILFDGHERRAVDRSALADTVAVVEQHVTLFAGTVRENLSLWDGTLPQDRLVQAAVDACIHREIVSRHGGYDAEVGEDGRNFSGGERQRLALARALARDPSVLILDEATSALDALTEVAVLDAIRRRGCSVLVVAHRLSTIRDCDEILVLERGRVIERGSHAELLDQAGAYANLVGAEGDVGG